MPIYEYKCDACGNQFEKLVRASSPSVACPSCGGAKVEQQYSTFAAQMAASKSGGACAPMPSGGCGAGACGMPGFCGKN